MKDIRRAIGAQIRRLRKERGLSQEKLGWKAGLHLTYIGAIERGEKNWSIDTLSKIAVGLDTNVADFFIVLRSPASLGEDGAFLTHEINRCSPAIRHLLVDFIKGLNKLNSKKLPKIKDKKQKSTHPTKQVKR